jgi:GNAT superfamily N-acetyltransferase
MRWMNGGVAPIVNEICHAHAPHKITLGRDLYLSVASTCADPLHCRRGLSMTPALHIRPTKPEDAPVLEAIRQAAFEPVFASFRAILGEEIYHRAQAHEDAAHGELLASLLREGSGWELYSAVLEGTVVGFVSLQLNLDRLVGEIGLNAVHPDHASKGVGTALYEYALERMRQAGMRVATVATGGDPGHAPARRAYEKAGFDVVFPNVWMCRVL